MKIFILITILFLPAFLCHDSCFDEQLDLLYQPSPGAQFYIDIISQAFTSKVCTDEELIATRPVLDQTILFFSPPTGLTSTLEVPISVGGQNVSAYWVWKTGDDLHEKRLNSTILYSHGGAWTTGSFFGYRGVVDRLAIDLDAAVLFVDYRLAPETKLPAQIEELRKGYKIILNTGVRPQNVIFSGDSAGGHLTTLLVQNLIRRGKPLPGSLALISPQVNLEYAFESFVTRKWSDVILRSGDNTFIPTFVLDDQTYIADPRVNPYYGKWKGFPPTLFIAGSEENLLSDSLYGATRVQAVGGKVKLFIAPNMPHAYALFGDTLEANLARGYIKRWFNSHKSETK